MKSQDILLLLKLASLLKHEEKIPVFLSSKWEDWEEPEQYPATPLTAEYLDPGEIKVSLRGRKTVEDSFMTQYSVRALALATGISKSEVSLSLQRSFDVGLAKADRKNGVPRPNLIALSEFIVYGLRYVFPAKPAEITRGIATAWAAPVLQESLMSAGDIIPVWPDPRGNTKGQSVEPLFKSVPIAVRKDPILYSLLALTDAIRIGQNRERLIAQEKIKLLLQGN